jgi:zinc/manganese transport system substrate-binding protein
MESWLDKAIRNNARDAAKRVVRVTEGIPKDQFVYHLPELDVSDPKKASSKDPSHHHDHNHDHEAAGEAPNPHVWLDPILARHCISNIVDALSATDPLHKDGYVARGNAYIGRIDALHGDMTTALRAHAGKPIVTFHDAFPYLCRRYQLDLVGVVEQVPAVDPSPKYLARLSAAIRARKVGVVFSEPQFNPRLVRQLSKDLGIQVAELDVLETGKPGAAFYEEGMRRNLASLVSALP